MVLRTPSPGVLPSIFDADAGEGSTTATSVYANNIENKNQQMRSNRPTDRPPQIGIAPHHTKRSADCQTLSIFVLTIASMEPWKSRRCAHLYERQASYVFDAAGRVVSVLFGGVVLADGFVYDTAGRLSAVSYPLAGTRLAPVVHDSNGNVTGLDFQTAAGVSFVSSTVTRAASGRVLTASTNGSLLWSYGYDAAGRLVSAAGSGHSYGYDFTTAVSGCPAGANANAGKNTNRSRLVDNGTAVVSYCYDMADRHIAASGIAYDSHQNQTLHDGDTYRYDQADRHLATLVAGVRQVTLTRDALDRVVARTDTDLATNTTSTVRYGFAGAGDLVSSVWDTANNLVETTVALPAGVLYTKRAGTGTDVWSYPNLHGDVAATRVNGTVTTFNWDPYGNPINNLPDNSAGSSDWGWLGQHQRTLDHPSGLNPVIEMGARVYQPDTGRFQQTDPIEDGTTTNPYSYVPDPINQYDLNGQWCMLGTIKTVGPDGKTHKKCRGRGIVSAPVRYACDHWRTLAVSTASTWLFRAVCV